MQAEHLELKMLLLYWIWSNQQGQHFKKNKNLLSEFEKKNHICLINVLLFALGRQLYGKMKVNLQTTRLLHLWKFLLFHEFSGFFLLFFHTIWELIS